MKIDEIEKKLLFIEMKYYQERIALKSALDILKENQEKNETKQSKLIKRIRDIISNVED